MRTTKNCLDRRRYGKRVRQVERLNKNFKVTRLYKGKKLTIFEKLYTNRHYLNVMFITPEGAEK